MKIILTKCIVISILRVNIVYVIVSAKKIEGSTTLLYFASKEKAKENNTLIFYNKINNNSSEVL